jgi:hypothetical protein
MDDDLNTPVAIDTLQELAEATLAAQSRGQAIESARTELRTLAEILGLRLASADER